MAKDLAIEIKWHVEENKYQIKTNMKKSYVADFLLDWMETQMGKGIDKSKREEKEIYTIKISLDMSDDSYTTITNTGNKGLTAGIVMSTVEAVKYDNVEWL